MTNHDIAAVDVVVVRDPIRVDVTTTQGLPGPPGPQGPPGEDAGPHAATHTTGGTDPITGSLTVAAVSVPNGYVQVGTNPAQSGAVRLANGDYIKGRNGANTADVMALTVAGPGTVYVGDGVNDNGLMLRSAGAVTSQAGFVAPNVNASTHVAIGTNPAQSGAVRLANNQAITARNAANTADVGLLKLDAADQVILPPHAPTHNTGGADPITALSAAILTTGTIPNARLPATISVPGALQANNASPNAPVMLGGLPADPSSWAGLWFTPTQTAANYALLATGGFSMVGVGAGGTIDLRIANASRLAVTPTGATLRGQADIETAVSIGTNPAQSGAVRLANNQAIVARNAANTADIEILRVNAAGQILIGGVLYTP